MTRFTATGLAALSLLAFGVVHAQGSGTAVVNVVLEPDLGEGRFQFSGTPAGELNLADGPDARLEAGELSAGSYDSVLEEIDPGIEAAGYMLTSISCDDDTSSAPSIGDVDNRRAAFQVEDGETVTCTFRFTPPSCVCPKEGRWRVQNHAGQMVCTGSFNMTQPLRPGQGTGTIEVEDGCNRVVARGMSDDEATIVMRPTSDCRYEGSVGGEQDGIPMTIHFTWTLPNSERIEGDLESTVTQSGATCRMSRTYELDYEG